MSRFGDDIGPMSSADKQADALRQLKFLYDCAVQLVASAEAAYKISVIGPRHGGPSLQALGLTAGEEAADSERKRSSVADSHLRKTSKEVTFTSTDGPILTGSRNKGTPSVADTPQPSPFGNILADFQGSPSQAVQLICMVRVLTLGHAMEAKEMKALTAVIEESRVAVKSVKGGMDPERAQEKLVKKLNELLELVKPRGGDLIISPEELLRCSYLRLSKENISRLEEMIREKGQDPGIHYHSDLSNYLEKVSLSANPSSMPTTPPSTGTSDTDLVKNLQPVSIYMTKPGAPINKGRVIKPDSVSAPFADEETARMKKFRAV